MVLAVSEWYTDVLEYLLQYCAGSAVDESCERVQDPANEPARYSGVTPLHLAAMCGKHRMVQSLIENGNAAPSTSRRRSEIPHSSRPASRGTCLWYST